MIPLSHLGKLNQKVLAASSNDPKNAYDETSTEENSDVFSVGGRNLWILKPVGLNRGQGIHVVDSFKKCKKLIKEYCLGKEIHPAGTVGNAPFS